MLHYGDKKMNCMNCPHFKNNKCSITNQPKGLFNECDINVPA